MIGRAMSRDFRSAWVQIPVATIIVLACIVPNSVVMEKLELSLFVECESMEETFASRITAPFALASAW